LEHFRVNAKRQRTKSDRIAGPRGGKEDMDEERGGKKTTKGTEGKRGKARGGGKEGRIVRNRLFGLKKQAVTPKAFWFGAFRRNCKRREMQKTADTQKKDGGAKTDTNPRNKGSY